MRLSGVPWWLKMAAKMLLSRLGVPYPVFRRLGLFRHGHMDSARYALDVFDHHVAQAGLVNGLAGKTLLEIGPGDSIATAILAQAHGARAILLDSGRHARRDMEPYRRLCNALADRKLRTPRLTAASDIDALLRDCAALYLTDGLQGLARIPDASVDLVFSHAVLEHVRREDVAAMLRECRRVLKPRGVCSHQVDLRDHLSESLNNLRFSRHCWESRLFAESGFYTNRIRYGQMLKLFSEAGFDMTVTDVSRWTALPIARHKLHAEFRDLPEDELVISGFSVVLRPAP